MIMNDNDNARQLPAPSPVRNLLLVIARPHKQEVEQKLGGRAAARQGGGLRPPAGGLGLGWVQGGPSQDPLVAVTVHCRARPGVEEETL